MISKECKIKKKSKLIGDTCIQAFESKMSLYIREQIDALYEVNRYGQSEVYTHTVAANIVAVILLHAIIHEDVFRVEENGRTGSRPLGLSGLFRQTQSEITTPSAFLLAVALLMLTETRDFPRRRHYPNEYLRHVLKATSAKMARTFKSWRGARSHPEWIAMSYKYGVQMRSPLLMFADF